MATSRRLLSSLSVMAGSRIYSRHKENDRAVEAVDGNSARLYPPQVQTPSGLRADQKMTHRGNPIDQRKNGQIRDRPSGGDSSVVRVVVQAGRLHHNRRFRCARRSWEPSCAPVCYTPHRCGDRPRRAQIVPELTLAAIRERISAICVRKVAGLVAFLCPD